MAYPASRPSTTVHRMTPPVKMPELTRAWGSEIAFAMAV